MTDGPDIPAPEATTVAALDVGSNSIRMVIADVLPDGSVEVLERLDRAAHLGQDTFTDSRLSRQTMNAAIAILADYRRIVDSYQVRRVRAVGTSAIREALNADMFLDRAYMSTGFDIEVINTAEESRLTISAVQQTLAGGAKVDVSDAVIVDVGGGSLLLTMLHEGQIITSESYRLGSIRIQESFETAYEEPERLADLIHHQIAGNMDVISKSLPMDRVDTFIAVGGDARFAARQIGKPLTGEHLRTIAVKQFDKLVDQCEHHSSEELARQHGLSFHEAETLVPALLVFQGLVHETRAKRIVVCDATMRDGLLQDLARSVTGQEDESLARSVVRSARAVAQKYRYNHSHADQVTELSLKLFDEIRSLHGLGTRHRLLLQVAAMLHEIGGYVSSRAHHKHSYYLVANSEIFGLSREEIEIVALITRYHRRATPRKSHAEYMTLPRNSRMIVSKLAAILRVADALDRGHAQQISQIQTEIQGNELVMNCLGVSDLTLERGAVARKADLFEDIYGLTLRLEEAPQVRRIDRAGESAGV